MSSSVPPDLADELLAVVEHARSVGMLGTASAQQVIDHSLRFARALTGVTGTVVDIGTGPGIPGLVIAVARPDLRLVLVDRRRTRLDTAERAVRRLGLTGRVEVDCAEVDRFIRDHPHEFDAAVSRSAGPPLVVLDWSLALVVRGGPIVISDPPAGDPNRWPAAELQRREVRRRGVEGLSVFAHVSRETSAADRPG